MLYDKVYNTIKNNDLIPKGSKVIAAVSGGADSVCLLDVLINLSQKLEITVCCAHLNHNLRGAESDADEEYVRFLCEKYSIEFYRKSVDIMSLSAGRSIEEVARNARYEFFDSLCKDEKTYVATAHTVNDNAETFFINLLRSSGSRGLCGIPSKRGKIIRPLLNVTRKEIISHLETVGLEYRTDSTNSDTDYLRNFIRHEIIPRFEQREDINIFKSISKTTENLYKENSALEKSASELQTDEIDKLCCIDDAILYRILTKQSESKFGIILDNVHFEKIKELLKKGSSRVQIRGDIYGICEKGKFYFTKETKKDNGIYPLKYGENKVHSKIVLIKKLKEIHKRLTKSLIDCDKIDDSLYIRTRREGDFFRAVGRSGTGKLSKLLKNDGVSKEVRDSLYVVCDSKDRIVFAEGYGANADYIASKESKNIIYIEIISADGEK